MSEDEAFIRAIVDSPGDDTARLVYADWLDDRDDPRGAYLRAEHPAVAAGNVTRLRELAAGLDAVWVARVSRPPVGVCCDHVGMKKSRLSLRPDLLDQVERLFDISLPAEYRAFLLNYNGGRSALNSLPHPELEKIDCELQPWYSLNPPEDPWTPKNLLWQIRYYRSATAPAFHSLIPLCAADPGYYEAFAISYRKADSGRVYHLWDFSLTPGARPPLKVADSLGYFLASIRDSVEPSVIEPGEGSAFES